MKKKMSQLPKGSKRWWSLNKQLLNRQAAPSFFPPLKNGKGDWCRTPQAKADAFVESWNAKNQLPPELFECAFFPSPQAMREWFPIRKGDIKKILKKLRLDQATGPDEISAIFLQNVADSISLPLAIICRRIFMEAAWPAMWKVHSLWVQFSYPVSIEGFT